MFLVFVVQVKFLADRQIRAAVFKREQLSQEVQPEGWFMLSLFVVWVFWSQNCSEWPMYRGVWAPLGCAICTAQRRRSCKSSILWSKSDHSWSSGVNWLQNFMCAVWCSGTCTCLVAETKTRRETAFKVYIHTLYRIAFVKFVTGLHKDQLQIRFGRFAPSCTVMCTSQLQTIHSGAVKLFTTRRFAAMLHTATPVERGYVSPSPTSVQTVWNFGRS